MEFRDSQFMTAKEKKLGLWKDEDPTPPWEFRHPKKSKSSTIETVKTDTKQPAEQLYWLNIKSNVRHNNQCKYFKKTSKGRVCTKDEGKACGGCGG